MAILKLPLQFWEVAIVNITFGTPRTVECVADNTEFWAKTYRKKVIGSKNEINHSESTSLF